MSLEYHGLLVPLSLNTQLFRVSRLCNESSITWNVGLPISSNNYLECVCNESSMTLSVGPPIS